MKVSMNFFLMFHLQNSNKIDLRRYLLGLNYYLNLIIEFTVDSAESLQENYFNI